MRKYLVVLTIVAMACAASAGEYRVNTQRGAVALNLPSQSISTRILVENMFTRIERLDNLCSRYPQIRAEVNTLLSELVALIVLLPSSCMDNVIVVPESAPEHARPMDSRTFAQFLGSLEEESFSSSKMKLLRQVATSANFTCAQLGMIIDGFEFSSDKLECARVLKPCIVDIENAFVVKSHFDYDSDKEKFMKLYYSE